MDRRLIALAVVLAPLAWSQVRLMPASEVRPGMRGAGRTVFNGAAVEEFTVEILGTLENAGPKQSVILARLGGGPLGRTGVMQGMSGSPVYIDGRLVGAVAYTFPFSKEPIAGIRPIEEMLAAGALPAAARANPREPVRDYATLLPPRVEVSSGAMRLQQLGTPLWFNGFPATVVERFAPSLRAAGLEPVQGMSGAGPLPPDLGSPRALEPGAMISVQLMSGDLNVGADGTVTHIDGSRIYAFGHRFLSLGEMEAPFARSEVITLLANQQLSFKISAPREWMGAILQDRSAAITGELGRRAAMLPVELRVHRAGPAAARFNYRVEMVRDRLMAPLLLQMAVYSAIEATERTSGAASVSVRGSIALDGAPAPVEFRGVYTLEMGAPMIASAAAAAPLAAILQGGFEQLRPRSIRVELDGWDARRQLAIDNVWTSRREVRPGEAVEVFAQFAGDDGQEMVRAVRYLVPVGAPAGTLHFSVGDATSANLNEYRHFLSAPPRTAAQLVAFLNGLRTNSSAWVRVWRALPSYTVSGETLQAPPPSLALMLGRSMAPQFGARVAELEMPTGDFAVTGAKTIQVEVKE